jgi:hypothetical protein
MSQRRNYENGYQGKIEYWSGELSKAVKENDAERIEKCRGSLNHFVNQQLKRIQVNDNFENDLDPAGGRGLHSHI